MKPIEVALAAATALACTALGYRVGHDTEARSADMADMAPRTSGRSANVNRSRPVAPADREHGQVARASTEPTRLVLPRMGSLDQRLVNGEVRLRGARIKAVTTVNRLVTESCRHLHQNGDTEIEVDVQLAISGGVLTILGVSNIGVRRGAPLDERAARCISQRFARPIDIADPNPAAGVSPGLTGAPGRRWYRMEGTAGTVVATARFTGRPDCTLQSAATAALRHSQR